MNKLVNKIVTGIVGIAMAIGVGLAANSARDNAIKVEAADQTASWPQTKALSTTASSVAGHSDITFKTSSSNSYTSPLRFYANVTMTITALNGASIKSVTYEASSTGSYVNNAKGATVTPSVTPSVSSKNVTWTFTGGTTEFTFKPSAQTRSTGVSVTYTPAQSATLSSIALSGTYPTDFTVGDTFSHTGMVVTATYDDSSTKDVSSSATWSSPDMSTAGNKTVTVSYTEGEVTKTQDYSITVSPAKALVSIALSGTYPTSFITGDSFSHAGMVVTATYNDSSTQDVSSSATWSSPDMSSAGTKTVTVSYTYLGNTASATYDITVEDRVLTGISLSGQTTSYKKDSTFSFDGTCTASYSNAASRTVTPTSVSSPDMSTTGTKTITVSYTENGVTKTAEYDISVYFVCEIDFIELYGSNNADIVGIDQVIDSTAGTKVVFNKGTGSSDPKYYGSGTAVRAYAGNNFVVSSSVKYLKSITLTFGSSDGSNTITTDVDTFTSPTWDAGSATDISSVTFTVGGSKGNRRITKISVQYIETGPTVTFTSTFTYLKSIGDTNTVTATIVDATGEEGNIVFASSNTSVATIDSSTGDVEAKGVGTTTISATATGATSASFELRVLSSHSGLTQNDALTSTEALAFGEYLDDTDLQILYYTTGQITAIGTTQEGNDAFTIDGTDIDLGNPTYADDYSKEMMVVGRTIIFYGEVEQDSQSYCWSGEVVYIQMPVLNSIVFEDGCDMTDKLYSSKGSYWDTEGLVVLANYQGESQLDVTSFVVWSFSVGAPSAVDFETEEDIENYSLTVTASYGGKSVSKTVTGITITFDGYEIHTYDSGWKLVTDASTLSAGDQLVIGCSSKGATAGPITSNYLSSLSSTFGTDEISDLNDSTTILTLGGSAGSWTLANSDGELLGATAAKKLAWDSGTTTWSISISDGLATITNGTSSYGSFLYNSSSPRFTTYTSDPTSAMILPELYRRTGLYDVEEDLINAVNSFYSNSNFQCDASGVNFDSNHWKTNSWFTSAMKDKYELSKIVANQNGNKIEKFLAMYDYVCSKYSREVAPDFLGRFAEGGVNYGLAIRTNPLALNINANSAAIVIIVSVVSAAAIAGYFFLRKRKEQ